MGLDLSNAQIAQELALNLKALQKFKLTATHTSSPIMQPQVTLRPKNRLPMTVSRR
jgi:hypothetical protein